MIPVVTCKLFQNYCYAFYSSNLWDLQCRCLYDFGVVWRKAVRRIWGLPPRMHNALLQPLMLGHNLRTIINNRFINFAVKCSNSNNLKVSFIANISRVSLLHNFGKNLNFVTAYNNSFVYNNNNKNKIFIYTRISKSHACKTVEKYIHTYTPLSHAHINKRKQ